MFLQKEDLAGVIYDYQLDEITESNDDIVMQALSAAEEEARSYMSVSFKDRKNFDGRYLYDVDAIFEATELDRNSLIMQHTLTIAKWHIVGLCNADIIYEKAKDRYDRAVQWFNLIVSGRVVLKSLPTIEVTDDVQPGMFMIGSRKKFNHDY